MKRNHYLDFVNLQLLFSVYKTAVINAVREFLAADLTPARAEQSLLQAARKLAQTQYAQLAWTEKF